MIKTDDIQDFNYVCVLYKLTVCSCVAFCSGKFFSSSL